jgi:hypothetical protein
MKFLQEELEEPNEIKRRMLQLIEVHKTREALVEKAQIYKDKVKVFFEKRKKKNLFQVDDMVLRWVVRRQDKESMVNSTIYALSYFESLMI